MTPEAPFALVIGGGPAGLMAADRLLVAGHRVILAEAKPSLARKFLMAGKSGLNLTKAENFEDFVSHYAESADWLCPYLSEFGPDEVCEWAESLGQPVFTGSSGRVFPKAMKASPLLRAWLQHLAELGLEVRTRWRWIDLQGRDFVLQTPDGEQILTPDVTVLALGGASWARLGADGAWSQILARRGHAITPFKPANMGFEVEWSPYMAPHFGAPLKSVILKAGGETIHAEAVISAKGIEGGGIYALSRVLREGAPLMIDLFPHQRAAQLVDKLSNRPKGESQSNTLRKALGLSGVRLALVQECARPLPRDARGLADVLKALPIPLCGPRPMDEAISTAGGLGRDDLTEDLMIRAFPGVFAAGEMLDWEAPTGGYLLTACFATGRHAGDAAARFLAEKPGQDQVL